MPQHKICVVCGQLGEGWHFGAFVCRPCASFFRRTIAEAKTYDCRHANQCQINRESRNCCRSCRLRKCIESGMKFSGKSESSSSPGAIIPDPHTSSSSSTLDSLVTPITGMENLAVLRKVADFIKSFYNSVQSIHACENPSSCLQPVESVPINQETYIRLEKVGISIMEISLSSYFSFFGSRNETFKMDVLEQINFRLMCLSKMLLSLHKFPNDDDKAAAWYGYHVDAQRPELFVGENNEMMNPYFLETIKRIRVYIRRYASSNIVELDIGVIASMVLINQMLRMEPLNEEVQQFKSKLIIEYHSYLINLHGMEAGIQRYTETLLMLNDTAELCHQIREDLTLFGTLLDALYRLEKYLSDNEYRFLTSDEMKHIDCIVLPKLHGIRIVSEFLKEFEIPDDYHNVWRYLNHHEAFKKSCPSDQEIILYWVDRKDIPDLPSVERSQLIRQKPLFSLEVPAESLKELNLIS